MNLKFRKSAKGKNPGKDLQRRKRSVLRSRGRRLRLRASTSGVESDGIFRFRNADEQGRLQSVNGEPAFIAYYPGGQLPSEKRWYDKGVLYSFDDKPAWIKYYQSGAVSEERWYRRGELHRFDGPALITYFPNGVVSKSVWYWDDSIRREENPGEPAVEIYDYDRDTQNFYLKEKQWYDGYNSRGRVAEPAVVTYYPSGDIASELWFTEDVPDREDGPAVITYYVNGRVKTTEWWIAGEELTEEEFNERTNPQESTMTNEGPSRQVWRNRSGELHRREGPAVIEFYSTGRKSLEEWWVDGERYRENINLPDVVRYYNFDDNRIMREEWHQGNDELGRYDDLPAVIEYYVNGYLKMKEWEVGGVMERNNDEPARIFYSENKAGRQIRNEWYLDNFRGREVPDGEDEADYPGAVELYDDEENRVEAEAWFESNGDLRESITYYNNDEGRMFKREFFEYGMLGSRDSPSVLYYFDTPEERVAKEQWYIDGSLGRMGGLPQEVSYFDDDAHRIEQMKWYIGGELNRGDNRPAVVTFFNNDAQRIMMREWYIDGSPGREDGKASTRIYFDNERNSIRQQRWETMYMEGKVPYRTNGPAVIDYDESGNVVSQEWYDLNGQRITEAEFNQTQSPTARPSQFMSTSSKLTVDENGTIEFVDDLMRMHNLTGPAKVYLNGGKEWALHSKRHRLDGPAVEVFNQDEKLIREEWWFNGIKNRLDGPAIITYDEDGDIADRKYWVNGFLQQSGFFEEGLRGVQSTTLGDGTITYKNVQGQITNPEGGGPAIIKPNGERRWMVKDKLHRRNGPALITENGSEQWNLNGMLHRLDGPAVVTKYLDTGFINAEGWWVNGVRHRLDGPAVVFYAQPNVVSSASWWIEGVEMSEEQFNQKINEIRVQQQTALSGNAQAREEEAIEEELPETLPPVEEPPRTIMPNDEPEKCKITLKGLDENSGEFLQSLNDLISSCNLLETASRPGYVNKVREEAAEELTVGTSINVKVDAGKEFLKIMSYPGDYLMIVNESHLNVQYRGQAGIDAGGLRRQFVTSVFQQIKSSLFKPIELHSTNTDQKAVTRYYIDHEISDDEIRLRLSLPPTANIDDVFEKAGNMFGNAVINGVDTDIPLSRVLYNFMLSPVPEDSDAINQVITSDNKTAVLYYLLDISTLISKIAISEDYEELFWDVAKGVYEIPEGSTRMLSFLRGFESMGTFLRERFVNANELLDLTTGTLTREKMSAFLNSGLVKYELQIPGTADERPLTNDEKQTFINEFILPVEDYKQFMFWWSGEPRIRQDKEYRFYFTEAVSGDFVSHTCSTQIDIKPYTLDPSDTRFRKAADWLKRAIYIVEFGIA